MNLSEFEKLVGHKVISNFNEGLGIWQACFEDGDIKEPGAFVSAWEDGKTRLQSIRNYCRRISGKTLVFNYKNYFEVPAKLTVK